MTGAMRALMFASCLLPPVAGFADRVTVESCGRLLTFDAPPSAAVANDVNMVEMMLALGLRDRMVGYTGVSSWTTIDGRYRDESEGLPELSPKYPNRETLVGAGADFYLAGWNYGLTVGGEVTPDSLEPLGIQVYELTESCIHVGSKAKADMDDLYVDLLNLGAIFNVGERAEALVALLKSELDEIRSSLVFGDRPVRVFVFDSGEGTPFTAGRYAMPTALIEAAGGVNIVDDLERSWATISWETVVDRNPEVIVIVNYGDVSAEQKRAFMMSNPAFASMDAVKNDRFVVLDYAEATPGPRNVGAVRTLVEAFWRK